MARVQGDDLILDPQGRLLAFLDGCEVTYYETDGVTPITIYDAETGGSVIPQPLTTRYGRVEPDGGGEWWHDSQPRIREVTHPPTGRTLPTLRQEAFSAVDSGTLSRAILNDVAGTVDVGTDSATTLTLKRSNASNTNALVLQSMQTGGRTTVVFRDNNGDDIARLVGHNSSDTPGVAGGFRVYSRRATPRLDGNMFDNRLTVQSELDFTNIYTFGATVNIETHDTDGNLWTDQSALLIFRSPGDQANESTELLRARTSAVGTNYFHRDLAAADTAGPLVRVHNDNSGDDQIALKLVQDGTAAALEVTHSGSGPAFVIQTGYTDIGEMSDPAGPSADRLRLYAKDTGGGKTILAQRTTSGIEHHYGALIGSTSWDPASLTNGQSERKSVTVTGAAVGDMAAAGLVGIAATGWDIQAAVIAANTVEVKITNNTGGTVDLGNSTVRAIVWKVA